MAITNAEQYAMIAKLGVLGAAEHGAFINGIQEAAFAALTPIATADATDPETTMALVNEIKAHLNNIVAALQL